MLKQLKWGPELLGPAAEAWLAYYLCILLSLGLLLAGPSCVEKVSAEGTERFVAYCALGLAILISLLATAIFHCLGHVLDRLYDSRSGESCASPSAEPADQSPPS